MVLSEESNVPLRIRRIVNVRIQTASKVLVVGGAGYIGSVLVRELLQQGQAVKVFDRHYYGGVGVKWIEDKVELIVGDMRDPPPSLLDSVSSVINIGGLSNAPPPSSTRKRTMK